MIELDLLGEGVAFGRFHVGPREAPERDADGEPATGADADHALDEEPAPPTLPTGSPPSGSTFTWDPLLNPLGWAL